MKFMRDSELPANKYETKWRKILALACGDG